MQTLAFADFQLFIDETWIWCVVAFFGFIAYALLCWVFAPDVPERAPVQCSLRDQDCTFDEAYVEHVEALAKECTCDGERPCDGLLAGGLCDDRQEDPTLEDDESL